MSDFLSLGISQSMNKTLAGLNIKEPTPIQVQAIPEALKGIDLMAQAQTGTGKTFAFMLPIIENLRPEPHVQALIVTPTRELALQITAEVKKLLEGTDMHVLPVYGGQDVERQLKKLSGSIQIVVATPGRLLDHLRRETVDLTQLKTLVLDEADQMLHIGFLPEVEAIIKETPVERQTLLFSATMSEDVRKLAKKHMKEAKYIQVEKKQGPAKSVAQLAIHLTDRAKQPVIIDQIKTENPFMAVLFCRTKRRVSKLYDFLKANGFSVDELHGDLSQAKRERVMKRFRDAEIQLLVATDVAARGLDVEGVTHVFNYDIPEDAESYVHRIGRTGRAGFEGKAITFYSPKDEQLLAEIEKELGISIEKIDMVKDKKEFVKNESRESRTPGRARENTRHPAKHGNGGKKRKSSSEGRKRNARR